MFEDGFAFKCDKIIVGILSPTVSGSEVFLAIKCLDNSILTYKLAIITV